MFFAEESKEKERTIPDNDQMQCHVSNTIIITIRKFQLLIKSSQFTSLTHHIFIYKLLSGLVKCEFFLSKCIDERTPSQKICT